MLYNDPCAIQPVFGAVVDDWGSKCSTAGVEFRYKLGCNLVGYRTRKSQLLLDVTTESQSTDDAALYTTSEKIFVTITQSLRMLLVIGVLQLA